MTGYVANYRDELARVSARVPGPRLWVFLGSSLGNYDAEEAAGLLAQLAAAMGPSDRFLLGTDLAKDAATLEAAYDDAEGVTAQFNLRQPAARWINREARHLTSTSTASPTARSIARPRPGRDAPRQPGRPGRRRAGQHALRARFAEGRGDPHRGNSHKYTIDRLRDLARAAGVRGGRGLDPTTGASSACSGGVVMNRDARR